MGNSFSSKNSIFLQCEKQCYYGGEVVQGVVCLNLVNEVTSRAVELKVTGYEKTHFTEQETRHSDGKTTSHTVHRSAEKKFFKVAVPLSPAGILHPGQYQFGFAFVLPADLPSSFSFHKGDSRGDVVYKVKAAVRVKGLLKSDIKAKQLLAVYQREYAMPAAVVKSAETEINFCCCFSRGHASAQIHVDKDRYMPGEQAHVVLQVDNQSSEDFDSVEVSLEQVVVLRAAGHSKYLKSYHSKQSHEGVGKYTTLEGGLARHIPLTLPPSLPPTTHGQIIACDYLVKVTLKTKGFWGPCVSDLKMKVPVVVFPPQPQEHSYVQPPPEWSPSQVFAPVAVEMPSAPPLPPDALDPSNGFWQRAMGGSETEGENMPLVI